MNQLLAVDAAIAKLEDAGGRTSVADRHVVVEIRDPERFRASAARDRSFGMTSKLCIHPDQVPLATEIFSPTAGEVERTTTIISAFEAAQSVGSAAPQLLAVNSSTTSWWSNRRAAYWLQRRTMWTSAARYASLAWATSVSANISLHFRQPDKENPTA